MDFRALEFPDQIPAAERLLQNLENATLTHIMGKQATNADVSVTTTRAIFDKVATKQVTFAETVMSGQSQLEGNPMVLKALFDMLDNFELMFEVVTPGKR